MANKTEYAGNHKAFFNLHSISFHCKCKSFKKKIKNVDNPYPLDPIY